MIHVRDTVMITVCFHVFYFLLGVMAYAWLCPDTHSRHGYSTSPRRHNAPYPPSRRAPPDPHTFDYPASLKQFADWFRYTYPTQALEEDNADKAAEQEAGDGSKPRNGIKSKWEKYKKDFAAIQVSIIFLFHSGSLSCVCQFVSFYDCTCPFVSQTVTTITKLILHIEASNDV